MPSEDFLTLYCDPGEDFGWCLGCGTTLLAAGTHKMWTMADIVWDELQTGDSELRAESYWRDGIDPSEYKDMRVKRVVCEDFRIYPWAAKDLVWDRVRTARVIGALTFMCRLLSLPFILQPAAIKKAAVAAGAEELFYRPLHENRHQNDAIMHFTWYTSTELLGLKMPVPTEDPHAAVA